MCLCEDIPLQETVAFGGQDWRQRDETEVQRVEGICTSSADCSRCSSRRSQGEATCKFLLTSVRVAVVFVFSCNVSWLPFHSTGYRVAKLRSDVIDKLMKLHEMKSCISCTHGQWRRQPTEVGGKVERDLSWGLGTETPQRGPGVGSR